jgi:golgin subfamily B member 1
MTDTRQEIQVQLKNLIGNPSDWQAVHSLAGLAPRVEETTDGLSALIGQSRADSGGVGDWRIAIALLDRELAEDPDDDLRADLLYCKGRILEDDLFEQQGAIDAYEQALEVRAGDSKVKERLEQCRMVQENWERVAEKHAEVAASSDNRDMATSFFHSAASIIWRNAPESEQIEELLRSSLQSDPRNYRASVHLERYLWQRAREREVAELLEERGNAAVAPAERVDAFSWAAEVWVGLDDRQRAADCYGKAFSISQANEKAFDYLVSFATEMADWSLLARVYEDALRGKGRGSADPEIIVKLALVYWRELALVDKAEAYFRRVRKDDPVQPEMLEFYRAHYRETGEPTKILALLDAAQRVAGDDASLSLSKEMAQIAEEEVGNLEKAIEVWKRIHRRFPNDDDTVVALRRLYRQADPPKWNALRELLKEMVEAVPKEELETRIALRTEVVEIYRDHLKLPVMVINTYNAILADSPDHLPTITALTDEYESLGRWNDLIGILQKRQVLEKDSDDRVTLLHRIANLWLERVGNQGQAIAPLEEILTLNPSDPKALQLLREIFQKRRNWRGLVALLWREAETTEGEKKRAICLEISELAVQRLGDPGDAIKAQNEILAADPCDREALEALSGLYRREERWAALAEVYRRQIHLATDANVEIKLLEDCGELFSARLRSPDNAIDIWNEILSLNPDHAKAVSVLRELYVQSKRWQELEDLLLGRGEYVALAECLKAAADRTSNLDLKVQLNRKAGDIYRGQLDDRDRAIKAYERVINVDPNNSDVIRLVISLYEEAKQWQRLLPRYESLLGLAESVDEQLELLGQIRFLSETHLGSNQKAFEWCARAYALSPENAELKSELERLAEAADAHASLAEILAARVDEVDSEEEKLALLRQVAGIYDRSLDNLDAGEKYFRQILEREPGAADALDALERCYRGSQRWKDLVGILCDKAENTAQPETQVALWEETATIHEERLGDPVAAIEMWQKVSELSPGQWEPLAALQRLHEARSEWVDLVDVLQRRIEICEDDTAKLGLQERLGAVLSDELHRYDDAVAAYDAALVTDQSSIASIEGLEALLQIRGDHRLKVAELLKPILEKTGDEKELVRVLGVLLDYAGEDEQQAALLRQSLPLHRHLADPQAAYDASMRILRLSSADADNRKIAVELADELDCRKDYSECLLAALDVIVDQDSELELVLGWELGQYLDEQLSQGEQAEQQWLRLLDLNPTHSGALERLERFYREAGQWVQLRAHLRGWSEQVAGADERRDLLLQISSLDEDLLGDRSAAIDSYRELLDLKADDEVALRALERLYEVESRWADLVDLLLTQIDFVDSDSARNELKVREALIRHEHMSEKEGAVDLLEEVLAADPQHDHAMQKLEEMVTVEDSLQSRIADTLISTYERRQDWEKLVSRLLVKGKDESGEEAATILLRVADIREHKLLNLDGTFVAFRGALNANPANAEAFSGLQRVGEEKGDRSLLAEAWQGVLDQVGDEESAFFDDNPLRARLLWALVKVQLDDSQDKGEAITTCELIFNLDPNNAEIAAPAADGLIPLYEEVEAWDKLASILKHQSDWCETSEGRVALWSKVGRLEDEILERPDSAIDSYQKVLEEKPDQVEALDALQRLYQQRERFDDLIELLVRRVDLCEEREERFDLWLRIASLQHDEIGDAEEAIVAYQSALQEDASNIEAMKLLAEIYRKEGRWSDLLEILERQFQLVEGEWEVGVLRDMVGIQHRDLGDLAGALSSYRAIIEREPTSSFAKDGLTLLMRAVRAEDWPQTEREADEFDLMSSRVGAAETLTPILEMESEWEQLVEALELRAEGADSPLKSNLLRRVAEVGETYQDDKGKALEGYRRAVLAGAADGDLEQLVGNLRRLAGTEEAWGVFAETIDEVVIDVTDGPAQVALRQAAAEVLSLYLDDQDGARRHYKLILDVDPNHREALVALEELYRKGESWENLVEILHQRAELESDTKTKLSFLHGAAVVYSKELARPEDAIADYERILEIASGDIEALDALESLFRETTRWNDLVELLGRRGDLAVDAADQAEVYFRIAEIQRQELLDSEAAIEGYQLVLNCDSGHERAVASLEGYLDDAEYSIAAADLLEPFYVGNQRWLDLIRVSELRLDRADTQQDEIKQSRRIASLYEEQLEDLDNAFEWYAKVFLKQPGDAPTRGQMLRLASVLDQWPKLAEVFSQGLDDMVSDEGAMRELALLLANVYDERLYLWEPAKACFDRLLSTSETDDETYDRLEALLTRHERWKELLGVYEDRLAITLDDEKRRRILLVVARVWEEALEDSDQAIDAYRALLDEVPGDPVSIESLERLYRDKGRWLELAELISRQIDDAEEEELIIELKLRLGQVYEFETQELPAAIDQYEEVLSREPNQSAAVEALERMVLERDQRLRISKILQTVYAGLDEWAKLVVIYDAQLEFIEDKEERIYLLREIARLHEERQGSVDLAYRALGRALEEDPTDSSLLTDVERLSDSLDCWQATVDTLVRCGEEAYDFELVAQLYSRAAELAEDKLDDRALAISYWQKAMGAREDDSRVLDALIRLYEVEGQYPELVSTLKRKAEFVSDPHDQASIYQRIASVYESALDDGENAIESWRQVLQLNDGETGALHALQRLYTKSEQWMELVWVLRRKIEFASSGEETLELYGLLAGVFEERLEENFEAITAYREILAVENDREDVLEALDRLFAKEGLWSDLLEIVQKKIDLATAEDAINALRFRAGAILANEIGDLESAMDRFEQVVQADPHHLPTRDALEGFLKGDSHRDRVAEILAGLYQTVADLGALVRVLELQLEFVDPEKKIDLLCRIAEVKEDGLDDRRGAFDTYALALEEDAGSEDVQDRLQRLAVALTILPELVSLYEKRLDSVYDTELSRALHLKVAEMLEDLLQEDERAEKHYRSVLDYDATDETSLGALDRILQRQSKWADLCEILEQRAELDSGNAEYCARLGEIQREYRQDGPAAISAYRDALERDPRNSVSRLGLDALLEQDALRGGVLDILEPLYEGEGDNSKLVSLLQQRLTTLTDPLDRVAILNRIATIQEDELGAAEAALETVCAALAIETSDIQLIERSEALARSADRFGMLVDATTEILSGNVDSDTLEHLAVRLGIWQLDQMNDVDGAEKTFRRVLAELPECVPAFDALERIYRAGDDAGLATLLWQRAELTYDLQQKKELLSEVGGLRRNSLDDAPGAIVAWKAVIDADDADARALQELAELYRADSQWVSLIETLERKAELTESPEERAQIKHEAADVLRSQLDDSERAAELFREILDSAPADERALAALEEIYRTAKDWIAVQEILVRSRDADPENLEILFRLAELAEGALDDPSDASERYREVLTIEAGNRRAQDGLETVLHKEERWHDLVEVLQTRSEYAADQGDGSGEIALLVRIARLWAEQLDDADAAADVLEKVLEREPENIGALTELARLYELTENWQKCREILEQTVQLGADDKELAEIEFRLGRVKAELENEEAAFVHYQKAFELDPQHHLASKAVEAEARANNRWERVAELMEGRLAIIEGDEHLEALRQLAAIYGDELKNSEAAVGCWERALEHAPEDPAILVPLSAAFIDADRLDEAEPILTKLVEQAGRRRSREVAGYYRHLAAIGRKRGDIDGARKNYEQAQRIDGTDTVTLIALGEIYGEQGEWQSARRIYRSMLLQNLDDAKIGKADVFLNLGKVHEALGEAEKATSMYERGLSEDKDHQGLQDALAKTPS